MPLFFSIPNIVSIVRESRGQPTLVLFYFFKDRSIFLHMQYSGPRIKRPRIKLFAGYDVQGKWSLKACPLFTFMANFGIIQDLKQM